jgi:hypothetical protein
MVYCRSAPPGDSTHQARPRSFDLGCISPYAQRNGLLTRYKPASTVVRRLFDSDTDLGLFALMFVYLPQYRGYLKL